MWSGVLAKIVLVVLMLNIVAGAGFFIAHTVREHPRTDSVWAVTVGTDMAGYAPVRSETSVIDNTRTFWEETVLVSVFVGANALVLLGFMLLGIRHG